MTDEAILRIKRMIISGELAPGDRLPPEKGLSEQLAVSRSSLREAVKALVMFRVLDSRRGDGTFVTSLQPTVLTEALAFVVELHQDSTVLELMEVRRILEAAAVRRAVRNFTAEDLDLLRAEVSIGTDGGIARIAGNDCTSAGWSSGCGPRSPRRRRPTRAPPSRTTRTRTPTPKRTSGACDDPGDQPTVTSGSWVAPCSSGSSWAPTCWTHRAAAADAACMARSESSPKQSRAASVPQ